jgi:O-antigen/teichoic acid export membrane protein
MQNVSETLDPATEPPTEAFGGGAENAPMIAPPAIDAPARVRADDHVELKRGAFLNTLAMLASNFRGIFTFLVARLLGAPALGIFSVAWSTTDILSKIGVFGLDNAIITFIARAEALGQRARSRRLFQVAIVLGLLQSVATAAIVIVFLRLFRERLGASPQLLSALAVLLCALPGVALYRISTSVSRGMKVMQHDIYSRGLTEPIVTTLGLLAAIGLGWKIFAPELAAIVGTGASGLVALTLAAKLFRAAPKDRHLHSGLAEVRPLIAYAAPISAYQLLNTLVSRLDIITLGYFVGRAPGVSLATVGIYAAVVDTANGLRKVNQAFNPIFAPVVAGITATGDHARAVHTYSRLAQWMLWILLPMVTVMALAGGIILLVFGPSFQQGAVWLGIVGLASATNSFFMLGETVIMVQRPRLNLLHSCITTAVAVVGLFWLVPRYGAIGAACGILLPYLVQGLLRYGTLRFIFHWRESWEDVRPPLVAFVAAVVPALLCRWFLEGVAGQLVSTGVFLALFGAAWARYHFSWARR